MPIEFAQPEPYSQAISSQYGALQGYLQDRDFALRAASLQQPHPWQPASGPGDSGPTLVPGQIQHPQQEDQLSQAEMIRFQRLQAAKSAVQSQVEQNILTPREASGLMTQIETGINPLQQRLQRAQEQAQLAHTQQMTAAVAHQNSLEATNVQMRARAGADGIVHPRDENGNDLGPHQWNSRTQMLEPMRTQETENAHQIAQANSHDDDRFIRALTDVEKAVMGDRGGEPTPEQKTRMDAMMRARGFHSSDLNEHRNVRQALVNEPPMTGRPPARWTDQQRTAMQGFDNAVQAGIRNYPDQTLVTFRRNVQAARELFQQFGSMTALQANPRAWTEYQQLNSQIIAITNPLVVPPPRPPEPAQPNSGIIRGFGAIGEGSS